VCGGGGGEGGSGGRGKAEKGPGDLLSSLPTYGKRSIPRLEKESPEGFKNRKDN